MKEEALKLADELEKPVKVPNQPEIIYIDGHRMYASQMIRILVEELDKQKEIDGVFDYYCDENIRSKQTKPTITKLDGKVVAITMTDEEHSVVDVLWKAPKPLSDEEIISMFDHPDDFNCIDFARAIEERHGIK